MSSVTLRLTVTEFCLHTGLSQSELTEIVGLGVVEPASSAQHEWYFDDQALNICRRAQRLRRELEIDWAGIAVALSLLDKIDRLSSENRQLSQRLSRFTS